MNTQTRGGERISSITLLCVLLKLTMLGSWLAYSSFIMYFSFITNNDPVKSQKNKKIFILYKQTLNTKCWAKRMKRNILNSFSSSDVYITGPMGIKPRFPLSYESWKNVQKSFWDSTIHLDRLLSYVIREAHTIACLQNSFAAKLNYGLQICVHGLKL